MSDKIIKGISDIRRNRIYLIEKAGRIDVVDIEPCIEYCAVGHGAESYVY